MNSRTGPTMLEIAAILTVAVCLGLLANHFSSRGVALFASEQTLRPPVPAQVKYLSLPEAKTLLNKSGITFVDARPVQEYQVGHIKGAINLPVDELDKCQALLRSRQLQQKKLLVVYCDGLNCGKGAQLTARLAALGYGNLALLVEGWQGWQQAGGPSDLGEAGRS